MFHVKALGVNFYCSPHLQAEAPKNNILYPDSRVFIHFLVILVIENVMEADLEGLIGF